MRLKRLTQAPTRAMAPHAGEAVAYQTAAQATVLSLVPDGTFGEFNTDEGNEWSFASARWKKR